MAEYIDRNKIPWPKTDNPKGKYWDRLICESVIESMEPADVIERSKIDKAIEEIENEIKFWSDKTACTNIEVIKSRIAKANSYKHALEILKSNIEG